MDWSLMQPLYRRASIWLASTLFLAALILLVIYLSKRSSITALATIGAFVAAAGSLIIQLWPGLFLNEPSDDELLQGMMELAKKVHKEWTTRAMVLLGEADYARINYRRIGNLTAGKVKCNWTQGDLNSLLVKYQDLIPRRLMIVGPPGSGKTLMAIRLVLDILASILGLEYANSAPNRRELLRTSGLQRLIVRNGRHRDQQITPVPVPVSISGWNGVDNLSDWLEKKLRETYRMQRRIAHGLVSSSRYILPVLDGLDEVDTDPRSPNSISKKILDKLSYAPGALAGSDLRRPIIVTCLTDFYSALFRDDYRLEDSVVIEIENLSQRQVESYIRGRFERDKEHDPFKSGEFQKAIRSTRSVLATALARPWLLTLAITSLQAEATTPEILVGYPTTEELEAHLLHQFIRSATKLYPRNGKIDDYSRIRKADTSQIREHRVYYTENDVRTWLAAIAQLYSDNGQVAKDIRPEGLWRLAGTTYPRVLHTLAGVLAGLAVACLAAELLGGVPGIIVTSAIACIGVGLALWAGLRYTPQPSRLNVRQFELPEGTPLVMLVVLSGAAGALGGFIDGGPATAVTSGIGATLAATVLFGLGKGIVQIVSPRSILQNDLIFGSVLGFSVAIAAALPGGLTGGIVSSLKLNSILSIPGSALVAVLVAVTGGIILGSRAWTRYAFAILMMAPRRRLPWRLMKFLEWSNQAGLLRISGLAYQFRHDSLRRAVLGDTRIGVEEN
jgi:hypothetical protein